MIRWWFTCVYKNNSCGSVSCSITFEDGFLRWIFFGGCYWKDESSRSAHRRSRTRATVITSSLSSLHWLIRWFKPCSTWNWHTSSKFKNNPGMMSYEVSSVWDLGMVWHLLCCLQDWILHGAHAQYRQGSLDSLAGQSLDTAYSRTSLATHHDQLCSVVSACIDYRKWRKMHDAKYMAHTSFW